ncbi:flagellar type III secretion system pore protein FliP [Pacificimonas sp. WHA3]|uniref:Flagellar biosynthetic protein FliP n=1 Tax=Pacificimonas pallii TaxID=2827236 RepID=A0ABS6SF04_9SPHN|nr:flagellar type III secretion system pore protein FliP [Pacificimonas pallii]MBV7256993.1 flagellar type III secretion system pore protein FliP [Pacificimonas pallii]
MMRALIFAFAIAFVAFGADAAFAQQGPLDMAAELLSGDGEAGGAEGREPLSFSLQVLILMTLLSVLPSVLLMMTAFTRIIIVLSILRQALGLAQTPPNQVLVGLSVFLTFFVMAPVFSDLNETVIEPYTAGEIGIDAGVESGGAILHGFMITQARERDIKMFADMAGEEAYADPSDVPFTVLLPAFVTSELKTAFQIGFLIFLPFLVIDLVVASVLMSLGMMMLSPTLISLPFKLLLFVAVDGWALTMSSLTSSFLS